MGKWIQSTPYPSGELEDRGVEIKVLYQIVGGGGRRNVVAHVSFLHLYIHNRISQFHSHVQNVQGVVLAGHTSFKHGGLYE